MNPEMLAILGLLGGGGMGGMEGGLKGAPIEAGPMVTDQGLTDRLMGMGNVGKGGPIGMTQGQDPTGKFAAQRPQQVNPAMMASILQGLGGTGRNNAPMANPAPQLPQVRPPMGGMALQQPITQYSPYMQQFWG